MTTDCIFWFVYIYIDGNFPFEKELNISVEFGGLWQGMGPRKMLWEEREAGTES